jgi:hypothetical protein
MERRPAVAVPLLVVVLLFALFVLGGAPNLMGNKPEVTVSELPEYPGGSERYQISVLPKGDLITLVFCPATQRYCRAEAVYVATERGERERNTLSPPHMRRDEAAPYLVTLGE